MTDKNKERRATYLESAVRAGLSPKAGAVFVTLLEAGLALSPKTVVLKTGLHRQYIYDAFDELLERRLVVRVGEGRTVKYQATSPDRLAKEAEKHRLDTLESVQNLMLLYDRSPAGVVEIIHGSQKVIENELQLLREAREGDCLDIIGGGGNRWVELFEGRIEEWESLRKEKRINVRYIGTEKEVRHNQEESVIENESRVIPGIGDLVTVSIRLDSVSFNFYEPEVLIVRVKNKAAVRSQQALFEILWNVAT